MDDASASSAWDGPSVRVSLQEFARLSGQGTPPRRSGRRFSRAWSTRSNARRSRAFSFHQPQPSCRIAFRVRAAALRGGRAVRGQAIFAWRFSGADPPKVEPLQSRHAPIEVARSLSRSSSSVQFGGTSTSRGRLMPVQPLHLLLHRLRWDPEFGQGRFALGYHDRVAGKRRIVPFGSITSIQAALGSSRFKTVMAA